GSTQPRRRDPPPRRRIPRACRAVSPTARAPARVELGRPVRVPATWLSRRQTLSRRKTSAARHAAQPNARLRERSSANAPEQSRPAIARVRQPKARTAGCWVVPRQYCVRPKIRSRWRHRSPLYEAMRAVIRTGAAVRSARATRRDLLLETLALRRQLGVLARSNKRFRPADRMFWLFLRWFWPRWREALPLKIGRASCRERVWVSRGAGCCEKTSTDGR